MTMLAEFKKFLFRGNVVDLAVAVVIGAAFGAVVTALVADLLTPIIAAYLRQAGFLVADLHDQRQRVQVRLVPERPDAFVSIAAAIFFFVVRPMNYMQAHRAQEDPDTKECPECTSDIPIRARRCPECTAQLAAV